MPRYYFHVKDGQDYPDLQGTVLEDLEEAKTEALRFAGDLLTVADEFWQGSEWSMTVTDGQNKALFVLRFMVDVPTEI